MKRCLGVVLCGLALVAASCSSGPTGAQSYTVQADVGSPAGKLFQYSAYYPGTIKARPGDSITFVNKGSVAPHTITFGVKADRSNSPPVVIPGVGENPVIFKNCVGTQTPTPKLTKCPTNTGATPAAYTGSGFWNAFLVPAPAPQGLHQVTLKLDSSIPAGTYTFLCALHGPMAGTLQVVGKDSERKTPQDVIVERDSAVTDAQAKAEAIPNPPVAGKTPTTVAAGWSDGPIAVNDFYPREVTVKAGSKVSFEAFSPFEPHTVTFGTSKSGSEDQTLLAPSGTKNGGSYSGGVANSGIFGIAGGKGPFPPGPYALTFETPGTYKYVCVLHPGMEGAVKVT